MIIGISAGCARSDKYEPRMHMDESHLYNLDHNLSLGADLVQTTRIPREFPCRGITQTQFKGRLIIEARKLFTGRLSICTLSQTSHYKCIARIDTHLGHIDDLAFAEHECTAESIGPMPSIGHFAEMLQKA